VGCTLTSLEVAVVAGVDVREALLVDRGVRVGFQPMRSRIDVQAAEQTDPLFLVNSRGCRGDCCQLLYGYQPTSDWTLLQGDL